MAEYIEREVLIQRLKNSPLFTNFGEDGFFICNGVIDIIKKQPSVKSAADVVEVRHGRWSFGGVHNGKNFYKCSNCLHAYPFMAVRYCPNCGAKMDGNLTEKENEPNEC